MNEESVDSQDFCDFRCPAADIEHTNNAIGACKRELAIWCKKYLKWVKKNDLCITLKRKMRESDPEYQKRFGSV